MIGKTAKKSRNLSLQAFEKDKRVEDQKSYQLLILVLLKHALPAMDEYLKNAKNCSFSAILQDGISPLIILEKIVIKH